MSTGLKNYQEFLQALQGFVGAGQNFTGNGIYTRYQPGGGAFPVQTGAVGHGSGVPQARFGNATAPPLGTRPARGPKPPYKPKAAVLQAGRSGPERGADRGRAVIRQIKKQLPVFVALVVLLVGALGVSAYLLSHQRFYLPAWVPGIGTDFYEVEAELPTAQAVVPGPGPDRERGRRQGRRGRLGQPRERARRRQPADQGQVQADLQGRDDPAAAQDRPEGHDPGARPRHARGRRAEGGRPGDGRQHAARRELGRGALDAGRRHARVPPDPDQRGRHRAARRLDRAASRERRRTCARCSSASSRPRATRPSSPACWPSGAPTSSARSIRSSRCPPSWGRRTTSWRGWSTRRTRTSRRSRRRSRPCVRRCTLFPTTLVADDDHAQRRERPGLRARPDAAEAAAVRPRAGPVAARPAAVPARDDADHPRPGAPVRARRPADRARPQGRHGQPGAGGAAPDAQLQGAEQVLQRARLRPAQRRVLPVLERLGGAQRRAAVDHPGRARPDDPRHRAADLRRLRHAPEHRHAATRRWACSPGSPTSRPSGRSARTTSSTIPTDTLALDEVPSLVPPEAATP